MLEVCHIFRSEEVASFQVMQLRLQCSSAGNSRTESLTRTGQGTGKRAGMSAGPADRLVPTHSASADAP